MAYSIFEYLYRDASNYKAWGELLLEGALSDPEIAHLRRHFEDGEFFIAEQIGIPPLYESLWQQCDSSPSEELDHVWHEFSGVRPATEEDLARLSLWGTTTTLIHALEKVRKWNLALSQNYEL